jgi:Tfp pilus assembly protein PilX
VISRLQKQQEGSALVIAILAMATMLSLGLATLAFSDGQRQLAAGERVRESAFNLAEAALNGQVFVVSQRWPGSSGSALPASCPSATTVTNCPDPATINGQFTGPDYANSSWSTAVQDNGGSVANYYSSTAAQTQPPYDANGDGKLWARAQAVVNGVPRTMVTQIKAQVKSIAFPKNSLTAGYFATTNSGRKTIIDTNGKTYTTTPGQPGAIAVRCTGSPGTSSSCLKYDPSKGQVSPPAYQTGYPATPVVTADQLNAMRGIAQKNGTYYSSGCPSNPAGAMVFVESGNCSYSTGTFNSLSAAGVLVIVNGTLSLGGNATYYGLVYGANQQNSTGYVVSLTGCSKIVGSVMVEGQGGVLAGSCGVNIAFANVTNLAAGYGDPAVVKSTWREVTG